MQFEKLAELMTWSQVDLHYLNITSKGEYKHEPGRPGVIAARFKKVAAALIDLAHSIENDLACQNQLIAAPPAKTEGTFKKIFATQMLAVEEAYLKAVFNFYEGVELDLENTRYFIGHDYVEQIDMKDGNGFQTWMIPRIKDLKEAQGVAKKIRRKRKHPQRIMRRDFLFTVIDPPKPQKKGKHHENNS